ncbi:hypothetical protein OROMI_024015 [Orobanche minor]
MAFWGIKVKPGKPYILSNDERGRRLRVTQATLGSGTSSRKVILRCKVGDKKPVYLCSLFPCRLQTCALNLEFEEDKEVCFSIIGSRSVHLTGFFCGDKSDSVGMQESPVAEAGNDVKPSSEKKKVTWVVWRRGNPNGKKAEAGKMVSVRYTGKLEKDNSTFDSNYERVPLKFRLGSGLLLIGWDHGIEGMLVGEKRRLRIPPEFGFGDDGPEGVPPNALAGL